MFFITFLLTPTIVCVIEKSANISLNYDFSEEENQKENKELKELKSDFTLKNQLEFIAFKFHYSKNIISENVSKHNPISEEIFIPPPELI
ncbi:hypothetical protein [Flavobacterium sp.]|uniref:hypothetical protein n=1 Tax=Flavobacterium sp. TaxID=239 RepID=UPI00286CE6E4|nr:hypothetical protein [Flavobacterium sp.]